MMRVWAAAATRFTFKFKRREAPNLLANADSLRRTFSAQWRPLAPMSSFRRATLPFDLVLLICCAFVFLTLGAMALYPGGTALDDQSKGYQFFVNFFSDLGRTVARNDEPNPVASKLFFAALTGAGLALGTFFWAFARFFWDGLWQRVLTTAGVLFGTIAAFNFVGVALYPANLFPREHVACVFAAFRAFPFAILCFSLALSLSRSYPRRGLWIFGAFALALVAYLALITVGPPPLSDSGLMVQAAGQKIVVYSSLLCVGAQSLVARRFLSAKERLQTASPLSSPS